MSSEPAASARLPRARRVLGACGRELGAAWPDQVPGLRSAQLRLSHHLLSWTHMQPQGLKVPSGEGGGRVSPGCEPAVWRPRPHPSGPDCYSLESRPAPPVRPLSPSPRPLSLPPGGGPHTSTEEKRASWESEVNGVGPPAAPQLSPLQPPSPATVSAPQLPRAPAPARAWPHTCLCLQEAAAPAHTLPPAHTPRALNSLYLGPPRPSPSPPGGK